MENIDYKNLAFKLFCWLTIGIVGIFFFKYLFVYILPFLIAWAIAYIIYPYACELSARIKLSRKICSFVMVLLLLMIIIASLFLIGNRLIYEVQNLGDYLVENSDRIADFFQEIHDYFKSLGERLPIINRLQNTVLIESITENLNGFLENIWQTLLEELSSAVPKLAANIVTALPNALFVSLITVIACFYFALDVDLLHKKIKMHAPSFVLNLLRKIKKKMSGGIKQYLKAYFLLFLITFAELFVGFLILGLEYAFVLAILIALIDFLPVLGTGAILLPWGIILFFMNDYFLGTGILIMFLLITVVRQIIEPKILGKSLGVHPLFTLVTLYLGFQLFGIFGMVFLPMLGVILFSKEEAPQPVKKQK